MPKLTIKTNDFTLTSGYSCGITETIKSDGSTSYNYYTSEQAKRATSTKTFDYTLPNGSEIKSMAICATIGKPTWGSTLSTINGQEVGVEQTVSVNIDASEFGLTGTVNIPFAYTCWANTHQHNKSQGTEISRVQQGTDTVVSYRVSHPSDLDYENVYLEIEYTCGVYLYHGENGALIPYQLYHAESGELTPYQLFNAVDGELVRY